MRGIDNVMILASAGSGKTYALTNRFVRLLALGAKPDRIVALTFTHKAAGEFFDEILKKLAHAASEPRYATRLAEEIGKPALKESDFLQMLRTVVIALHQLRLGTFDGFFARIARNFPLELGLSGEFEILQEHASQVERQRVLRRLFDRVGPLGDAQREFIEAFKRATFGVEEKRLRSHLDAFLNEHQELYLLSPQSEVWGNESRIWPLGCRWLSRNVAIESSLTVLQSWVSGALLGEKQRTRWNDFIESCRTWSPGIPSDRRLEYVLEKVLLAWADIEKGFALLEFDRRKQELNPAACRALAVLTRHVLGGEISRRMEITRGIHAVLHGYEKVYHDLVRRTGKLTFGDVQRLLVPGESGPYALSQNPADERRLYIDFRLDAEIDHWLLDEFQDTSHGQWSVLKNLVDEALQDPTGTRSFFYVGDVKQAIFAWRDGDPRLFREIFDQYNTTRPGTIVEGHLDKSWRSGRAVIDTVNRVFGDKATLTDLFPGAASATWNREWREHEPANLQMLGQVALLHGLDEIDRFSAALAVIEEVDPLARGLSCALLVQSNQTASRLADYLRREGGFPAIADSDLHVCFDNPLGTALLALVKAAAHPGDTLAREHLRMTPLGELLTAHGVTTPDALTLKVLGQIHAVGFERSMIEWIRRLEERLGADDQFSRERGRQFADAAALFDETGSRDVAEFIQFMEPHTIRDSEEQTSLRVMTIHKAKGLGFDLVILPDLEGIRLDCRREGLAVQKDETRAVEWILDLPGKLFHQHDEVLSAHVRAAEADACYESLSLLYVAMTRAKRAMYLITKPVGKSVSRNYPKLLASTLGEETSPIRVGQRDFAGAYALGVPDWFREREMSVSRQTSEPRSKAVAVAANPRMPRTTARRPSSVGINETAGVQLFSRDSGGGREFGAQLHGLLAEIKWKEQAMADLFANWQRRDLPRSVISEAIECVKAPALEEIWAERPRSEVWRERSFEVILDGAWTTGVFDRVIIEADHASRPIHALVIDFKTDRIETADEKRAAVARHASQLELYARVAGVITGLTSDEVTSALVFTSTREIVRRT